MNSFESPNVSAEENEKLLSSLEEADPTSYSSLDTFQIPISKGKNVEIEGKEYHEIKHSPELQQMISRMLKGIIPVSDIIRNENPETGEVKFYSRIMPLDQIEHSTDQEEVKADIFILKHVLGDHDRGLDHNMLLQGGKAVYFDFENARFSIFNRTQEYIDNATESLKGTSDIGELQYIVTKLDLLNERFSGESGERFLVTLLKNSGKEKITDLFYVSENFREEFDNLERFQSALLERIQGILAAAQKRISNLQ